MFKSSILNSVGLREKSAFAVHDINGLKLLTRLRLNCNHPNDLKLWHKFDDTINWMCQCNKESTTTQHYHLRCDFYSIYRLELLTDICALTHSLKNILEENLLKVLLYGAVEFSFNINSETLQCTKKFIKKQIGLLAHYFFLSSLNSPLIKYLVFNIFYIYFMNNLCTKFTVSGICLI